jgi:hypothetical protein
MVAIVMRRIWGDDAIRHATGIIAPEVGTIAGDILLKRPLHWVAWLGALIALFSAAPASALDDGILQKFGVVFWNGSAFAKPDGTLNSCAIGTRSGGDGALELNFVITDVGHRLILLQNRGWQLTRDQKLPASYRIDDAAPQQMSLVALSPTNLVAVAHDADALSPFRHGRTLSLTVSGSSYRVDLADSDGALLMLEACYRKWNRDGWAALRPPSVQAEAMALMQSVLAASNWPLVTPTTSQDKVPADFDVSWDLPDIGGALRVQPVPPPSSAQPLMQPVDADRLECNGQFRSEVMEPAATQKAKLIGLVADYCQPPADGGSGVTYVSYHALLRRVGGGFHDLNLFAPSTEDAKIRAAMDNLVASYIKVQSSPQ